MNNDQRIKALKLITQVNHLELLDFLAEFIAEKTCSVDSSDYAKMISLKAVIRRFDDELTDQFGQRM